jgi:DNA-binding MarR family transcriptional regulator
VDIPHHNLERVEKALDEMRYALAGARQKFFNQSGLQLTRTQMEIVFMLAQEPKTTSDLAKALFLTQSAVTQTVDTLVRQGLLERRPDETDRRTTSLYLLEEGKKLAEQLKGLRRRKIEALLSKLTNDEVEAMISITKKLTEVYNEAKK